MKIRKLRKNEYEEMRSVWCEVFGDEPEFVDKVYTDLKAKGYVCEHKKKLHSFLTLFDVGEVNGQKVQVSYAICTRPESRGHGYAKELVKYVRDKVTAKGNISLICPAEDRLVLFYGRLDYDPGFYARELTAESNDLNLKIQMVGHMKYNKLRNEFLADVPHVQLSNRFAKFIKEDSVNSQGYLLINGGDAICAIDHGTDDEMYLSELLVNPTLSSLSSEIAEQIAGGLAALFEVERVHFRTTTRIIYGDKYPSGSYAQGMIAGYTENLDTASILPYYGFPID